MSEYYCKVCGKDTDSHSQQNWKKCLELLPLFRMKEKELLKRFTAT